jgi:phosphoglycolate phosphatase-like HAD superfamily hydrolase
MGQTMAAAKTKKILLFDIDGTLLLAGKAPVRAFHAAFEAVLKRKIVPLKVKVHGTTDTFVMQQIALHNLGREFTTGEFEALTEKYFERLPAELAVEEDYRILPGAEDLVMALKSDDRVGVGLGTGNLEQAAMIKLRQGGLDGYFSFGGYGSDHVQRDQILRIALEKGMRHLGLKTVAHEDVVVIGDTPLDVTAAKQNGFNTIAVATGNFTAGELAPLQPTHLLTDLCDLDGFMGLIGL